jgi:hypothetical protein
MEGIKKLEIFLGEGGDYFVYKKCVNRNIISHILVVEEKLVL